MAADPSYRSLVTDYVSRQGIYTDRTPLTLIPVYTDTDSIFFVSKDPSSSARSDDVSREERVKVLLNKLLLTAARLAEHSRSDASSDCERKTARDSLMQQARRYMSLLSDVLEKPADDDSFDSQGVAAIVAAVDRLMQALYEGQDDARRRTQVQLMILEAKLVRLTMDSRDVISKSVLSSATDAATDLASRLDECKRLKLESHQLISSARWRGADGATPQRVIDLHHNFCRLERQLARRLADMSPASSPPPVEGASPSSSDDDEKMEAADDDSSSSPDLRDGAPRWVTSDCPFVQRWGKNFNRLSLRFDQMGVSNIPMDRSHYVGVLGELRSIERCLTRPLLYLMTTNVPDCLSLLREVRTYRKQVIQTAYDRDSVDLRSESMAVETPLSVSPSSSSPASSPSPMPASSEAETGKDDASDDTTTTDDDDDATDSPPRTIEELKAGIRRSIRDLRTLVQKDVRFDDAQTSRIASYLDSLRGAAYYIIRDHENSAVSSRQEINLAYDLRHMTRVLTDALEDEIKHRGQRAAPDGTVSAVEVLDMGRDFDRIGCPVARTFMRRMCRLALRAMDLDGETRRKCPSSILKAYRSLLSDVYALAREVIKKTALLEAIVDDCSDLKTLSREIEAFHDNLVARESALARQVDADDDVPLASSSASNSPDLDAAVPTRSAAARQQLSSSSERDLQLSMDRVLQMSMDRVLEVQRLLVDRIKDAHPSATPSHLTELSKAVQAINRHLRNVARTEAYYLEKEKN